MSASEQLVLSIRGPADLLAVTPYVLGYHPSDSIVILGLSDTRIVFAARTDLPESDDDPGAYARSVAKVAGIAARQATEAMLVGYGAAEAVTPVIDLARRCLATHGLPVREALRLTDRRYYSYVCTTRTAAHRTAPCSIPPARPPRRRSTPASSPCPAGPRWSRPSPRTPGSARTTWPAPSPP
jgi:hypothetical protein